MSIFGYVGVYAPIALFVSSVYLLRKKQIYLNYFVSGFILNNGLNILLKLVFKEPRPSGDQKAIEIGVANGARISFDKFGMPSGHAQNCAFCLAYITLVLNSPLISGIYALVSLISVSQRYIFNNHSISQLIIGLLVGLSTGWLFYKIGTNKLTGNIKMRRDDDGPI